MRGSFTPFIILCFVVMVAGELAILPLVLAQQSEETRRNLAVDTYLVELRVETFEIQPPATTGGPCGDGTIGHGISYGPRAARQGLVVWECETLKLRATRYGPPSGDLNMVGPVVARATVDLPEPVIEWLLERVEQ